ncbi:uncharacterized protein [Kogia breviceps]|uniref:uncharacterized protein n=1 Tax=Kogia breviceps TaxID=27615 RepID=UPI0034D23832
MELRPPGNADGAFRGSGEEKPRISLRGPAGGGSPASGRAGAPPPTPAARWALPAARNRRVGPAPEGPRILSLLLPGFLNSGPLPPRSFPEPPSHSCQPRLAGLPRGPVRQRRPERAGAGRPPRSGFELAAPAPGAARAGLVLLQDPCDVRGRLNNPEGCFSFPKHTVKKKPRSLCCRRETERSRHGLLSVLGLQGKERAAVKNLSASAGDTGSSPGLGRSHMLRSN